MKKILSVILFSSFMGIAAAQNCNVSEATKYFNEAQNSDDDAAAELYEKSAQIFKCSNQYENYLIAAYQSGVAYVNTDRHDKAVEILENAIADTYGKTDSTSEVNVLIYHTLGEAYYGVNNPLKSIFYYNKVLGIIGHEDSETLAICLFNMGNSYESASDYEAAKKCHLRSIEMKKRLEVAENDDYYQAYTTLGNIYESLGKTDSSAFYYRLAGNYSGDEVSEEAALLKYKEALKNYNDKNFSQAEALFSEVKNTCETLGLKNDLYVNAYFYLGLLSEQQDDFKRAENYFGRALAAKTTKDDTYYNVLLAYGRTEQYLGGNAMAKFAEVANNTKDAEIKGLAQIEMAKIYEQQNNLEMAKNLYSNILPSTDSLQQPIIYVQAVLGLGNYHSAKGNSQEAINQYLRANRILAEKDKELEAVIYESIGNEYFNSGNVEKAKPNYQKAYSITKELYGSQSPKTASAEEKIAAVYMSQEKFADAVEIYKRSLAVKTAKNLDKSAQTIDLYTNYGNAEYNLSNYDEAGKIYEKAIQIIENDNIAAAKLDVFYNNYGLYCKAVGDYKLALDCINKSLEIKKKQYGENNSKYAATLNNLGTIYSRLGNFNKALECFETAEKIFAGTDGTSSERMGEVYLNMGNLYNRLGQNDLALDYYNKALTIETDTKGASSKQLSPIYNNIGTIYQNLEEYRQALFYFRKSISLLKENGDALTQEMAETYNNLGNALLKSGNNSEAVSNYKIASDIYSKIPSANQTLIANTDNNIATAYLRAEKLDSAHVFYNNAVEIYKKSFGSKHPYIALVYNSMGDINVKLGKYDDAVEDYGIALEANHEKYDHKKENLPGEVGFFDQNVFVNSLLSRANALTQRYLKTRDKKDLEYALEHFKLCDNLITQMRRSAFTKTDKLVLGALAIKCYEGALEVCTELIMSRLSTAEQKKYEELAFSYVEKGKSNNLLESMASQDALKLAGIPDDLQQKENKLAADVLYFEQKLAEKPKNAAQIRDSLFNANKRHDSFVKELEKKYPEYHQLKYADNIVGLRELQKNIKPNTQLRMYLINDKVFYAVCITSADFKIVTSQFEGNIADTARTYRNSILQSSQNSAIIFSNLSYMLYTKLFPDTLPDNITNLVIVPDGALNQIPYETLTTAKKEGSVFDYSNYDYLIKKYSISYAYSATLYNRNITRNRNNGTSGWFGMAPVFTKGKFTGVELNSSLKKEKTFNDLDYQTNSKIEPLASSEQELRNIFSMFTKSGIRAKALLWGCANKSSFANDSISNYKYIHLATHGFVNSEKPELSGIQFSQSKTDDGMMYSGDVYNLTLKCDLLALSACETGLGKIMRGEGIVGLTRAFLYSGASNLLVSLWKVSDNSTSQMMVEFYQQMLLKENNELNYAALLQKAKQILILDKNYSRPYYWAPFILIGD